MDIIYYPSRTRGSGNESWYHAQLDCALFLPWWQWRCDISDIPTGNSSRNQSKKLFLIVWSCYWNLVIQTWSMLRHTHVIRKIFTIASWWFVPDVRCNIKNSLAQTSLMIDHLLSYMSNGNALDYVRSHTHCNRLQIVTFLILFHYDSFWCVQHSFIISRRVLRIFMRIKSFMVTSKP